MIEITKEGVNSKCPAKSQADWDAAGELLETAQYEQMAELLHGAKSASEDTDNKFLSDILEVAHNLCLACSQTQSEIARHQQACARTSQREQELKQQLYFILDLVSQIEVAGTEERPAVC